MTVEPHEIDIQRLITPSISINHAGLIYRSLNQPQGPSILHTFRLTERTA